MASPQTAPDRDDIVAAVAGVQAERDELRALLRHLADGSRLINPHGDVVLIVPGDLMAAIDAAAGRGT